MIKEGTTLKDLLHEDPSLALEAANLQKSLAACKQAMLEPCTTDDVKGIWLMGPQVLVRATWSERLSHLST